MFVSLLQLFANLLIICGDFVWGFASTAMFFCSLFTLGIYLAKATGVCVWQHLSIPRRFYLARTYIYLVIGLSPALTNQRLLGVESLPAMTARVGFGFT